METDLYKYCKKVSFGGILGITLLAIIGVLRLNCALLTNNLPGVAEDLLNEGYTSVHCDPNKVLNPQLAGCDDEDQIAIECAARTVEGESVVITVCSEIRVDR
jgi:hypothetical protein